MHYGEFDFTSNGKIVIVPKQSGVSIGQRDGLSTEDVKELRNLFKCSSRCFIVCLSVLPLLCSALFYCSVDLDEL